MEKSENWYSIIQYSPDTMKGEKINIGLLMNNVNNQEILYRTLSETNIKLKSLFLKKNSLELYKVNNDFLNYYIENSIKERDIFLHSTKDAFFSHIQEVLPKGMLLTEPTYATTDNSQSLFNKLMEIYIGEEFLKENEKSRTKIKRYVRDVFTERSLINNKVKVNARINPIKDKELISYTVDFVYKNGVVNLMQVAPSKENLHNWFNKFSILVENYKNDSMYHVLVDDYSEEFPTETFYEMVEYLKERTSSEQFNVINIRSQGFIDLCDKIEQSGKLVADFEKELIVS